jgi:hypothetical protein
MDRLATTTPDTATCPFRHAERGRLGKGDALVLEAPKRMVLQYMATDEGQTELVLFYGGKEVTFDEPHLFTFGETLARQSRFTAGDALSWGNGLDWNEVRDCLASLIDEGILIRAEDAAADASTAAGRSRPSPLAPAEAHEPESWNDLEAITAKLTGRAVEPGWLELVVPVFRVAHMAVDADDRQVGEANVFPRALRLDRPTEWMACTYAGTRYLDPKPMNVTAMKAMRAHWTEMMMALAVIRDAYLARYPGLDEPFSIGAIERLATLVLALPTYQLVKPHNRVASGEIHPALSSLFRVTDGLRLVMHMMLFVPVGEPTLPPWKPVSIDQILDYAERNFAFHSETGVCAGPRHFVRVFLEVLVEGKRPEAPADFTFSPQVAAALAEIEQAFDYGLEALRAHAALFAIWPATARCYDRMAEAVAGLGALDDLDARLQDHLVTMAHSTYLGSEAWRRDREAAYADMFAGCSAGLGENGDLQALPDHGDCAQDIALILENKLDPEAAATLAAIIAQFAREAQSLLAIAVQCQARINARLGRPAPQRSFSIDDLNVHVRMQGERPGKRLPFLIDELKPLLGLSLAIEAGHIRSSAAGDILPH